MVPQQFLRLRLWMVQLDKQKSLLRPKNYASKSKYMTEIPTCTLVKGPNETPKKYGLSHLHLEIIYVYIKYVYTIQQNPASMVQWFRFSQVLLGGEIVPA